MYQYESLTSKTSDLNDLLNIKAKDGWEVESCQLMSNQAGVFLLLKKEFLIFDDEPQMIPLFEAKGPIKKRPGRKPGSKNKVKNAKST